MATAKLTVDEITDIQRRMAEIRHELHQDVQEAVKGAQALADWRSPVRSHPWLALGAAAAVGFLVVPKRRPAPAPPIVAVAPAALSAEAIQPLPAESRRKRWGVFGAAFGLLAPIAVRAAQNYAIQYLEQWIANQPAGRGTGLLGSGHTWGDPAAGGGSGPQARPSSPFGSSAAGRPRPGH
jgi:hypothetical protein